MNKWEIDVAVLCIFFARPDQFKKTFEAVKKARPRVLLLWQDGPREGRDDDIENIKRCREIAEDIDWDCEVYRNYHENNMGCDPSTHLSHKWAFSIVDKCIILEDDLIPVQSFFPFCKEMLDRFENDTRIDRICGTNLLGTYNIPYDYFFTACGNSWGWATWKRVADTWESNYEYLTDSYALECMRSQQDEKDLAAHMARESACFKHREEKVPYWEHIVGARTLLNHGLVIYPKINMIHNIGLDSNSTHAPSDLKELPKSVQYFFLIPTSDLSFPLHHPKYIVEDRRFGRLCAKKTKMSITEKICWIIKRVFKKVLGGRK